MPTPKVVQSLTELAKVWDKVEADMKNSNGGLPNNPGDKIAKLVTSMKKPMDELEKLTKEAIKLSK